MPKQKPDMEGVSSSTSFAPGVQPESQPLWRDRRRPFFGLPLSFTVYSLYPERLIVQSGLLTRHTEEIRLYRVVDASLRESLFQRLFRLGSIKLVTADATAPKIFLHDIRDSAKVLRLVSDMAEKQRTANRIGMMEFFDGH